MLHRIKSVPNRRPNPVLPRRVLFSAFLIVMVILFAGCGESRIEWPSATGYVYPPKSRPSSPHQVQETSTRAEIIDVGEGQFLLGENSSVEYRESRPLLIFPGAQISYLSESPPTLTLEDYNGDECILPYGITVKVDEYGQFIPIKYTLNNR